ncbi:MAG: serine/threonine protein kinase [Isosphaera sp.]|nr:serine/threonine protein kinase [Isosphaera sp.]
MHWLVLLAAPAPAPPAPAAEWSQFRGPTQDGHAAAARPPAEWDNTKNVTWRKELPGNGWSSPVVAGGKVFLTTAVPGAAAGDYSLRALGVDAKTGEVVWDREVFAQSAADVPRIHQKNSHASPTAVVDGGVVFVHFGHMGTAALSAKDGTVLWTQKTLGYKPVHGNGGSPVVAGDRLVFSTDGTDRQEVIALDKKTGAVAWRTPRMINPTQPFSFSTPLLATIDGKEQLISAGSGVVMSLDPKTGAELWRVKYAGGYSVVPKPVLANGLVYVCTGYNTPTLLAIKPGGTGDVTATHVAWAAKKNVPHNPSVLAVGGDLYLVSDRGELSCLDGKTGAVRWTESVGGNFSASPLYANGLVYLLDEAGTATVFKPGAAYDPVATNKLGERALASYGVDGDALLVRTEKALYRIEKK